VAGSAHVKATAPKIDDMVSCAQARGYFDERRGGLRARDIKGKVLAN
jgi:hypothetical protein